MAEAKYSFQYCQKLVVLNHDKTKVFLAKRQGEADYDGAWSLIGGKMEVSDTSIIAGLKREKNEEVGKDFKLKIYAKATCNILVQKKDGSAMILPHYLAIHEAGKFNVNHNEYSEAGWFSVNDLKAVKPIIENIPDMVQRALELSKYAKSDDFITI